MAFFVVSSSLSLFPFCSCMIFPSVLIYMHIFFLLTHCVLLWCFVSICFRSVILVLWLGHVFLLYPLSFFLGFRCFYKQSPFCIFTYWLCIGEDFSWYIAFPETAPKLQLWHSVTIFSCLQNLVLVLWVLLVKQESSQLPRQPQANQNIEHKFILLFCPREEPWYRACPPGGFTGRSEGGAGTCCECRTVPTPSSLEPLLSFTVAWAPGPLTDGIWHSQRSVLFYILLTWCLCGKESF